MRAPLGFNAKTQSREENQKIFATPRLPCTCTQGKCVLNLCMSIFQSNGRFDGRGGDMIRQIIFHVADEGNEEGQR